MKFNPHFNLKQIIQILEKAANDTVAPSFQAASTLGELYYLQGKRQKEMIPQSLSCYEKGASAGCVYSEYWVGYLLLGMGKESDLTAQHFLKALKGGNINSAYQLFLLYSKDTKMFNIVKAYKMLKKCCDYSLQCFDELQSYFSEHVSELKLLDESWKSWPDKELITIHGVEVSKQSKKFNDAVQTDALYKRPSVQFIENKGNWFFTIQIKHVIFFNIVKKKLLEYALNYPYEEFIIALKEELLPIFSSVGVYILENMRERLKNKKKDVKVKKILVDNALELVNLYLTDVIFIFLKGKKGLDGIIEKLKLMQKRKAKKSEGSEIIQFPITRYIYTDYIHPSYFAELDKADEEPIVCASCKKPQGTTKFQVCSRCKRVLYCSKECQVKDWKAGHKIVCVAPLKEGK